MDTMTQRDDRVLTATRWTVVLVAPILLIAGVLLFGAPSRTEQLWAWTINPPMTAVAVGGGYLAGAVFFALAAASRQWHRLRVGLAGASALSGLLLLTTVSHWDRFDHDHVSFWAWLVLYAVTPVLLPVLLVTNDRRDPGVLAHDSERIPMPVRAVVGAAGLVQAGVAAVMTISPSTFFDLWPWALTPLTARTLGAFLVFIAVVWLGFLVEDRWSALELPVGAAWLGLVLVAAGAVLQREQFGAGGRFGDVLFVVALSGTLVGMGAVQLVMRSRIRSASDPPPPSGIRRG